MSRTCGHRPSDSVRVALARIVVGMRRALSIDVGSSNGGGDVPAYRRCADGTGYICSPVGVSRKTDHRLVEVPCHLYCAVVQGKPVFSVIGQNESMTQGVSAQVGVPCMGVIRILLRMG